MRMESPSTSIHRSPQSSPRRPPVSTAKVSSVPQWGVRSWAAASNRRTSSGVGTWCQHLELHLFKCRGPGPFCRVALGRVALGPLPTDRLAESGRQHRVLPADAGGLQRTSPTLVGGEHPVEIAEVPGRQVPEGDIPEGWEDGRLCRPPGLVRVSEARSRASERASHSSTGVRTVAVEPGGSTAATSTRSPSSIVRASVWCSARTDRVAWRGWPVTGSVPSKTRSR